jgi:nitrogen fixation-related uncharacterized protein
MVHLKTVHPGISGHQAPSRGRRIFLWFFSIAMILTAGTAFTMKLIDFYITATREGAAALGSFLVPVMNYLCIAAGFAALFVWAYSRGQFRDVEAPKYRMLEQNRLCDEEWERERGR